MLRTYNSMHELYFVLKQHYHWYAFTNIQRTGSFASLTRTKTPREDSLARPSTIAFDTTQLRANVVLRIQLICGAGVAEEKAHFPRPFANRDPAWLYKLLVVYSSPHFLHKGTSSVDYQYCYRNWQTYCNDHVVEK